MDTRSTLFTRVFVLVWLAGFLQEVAWSLLVHFPGFLTDLGATESRIGLLYAGSAVLALVARPFLGRVMDIGGRRRVLLVAGAINGVVLLALTLVNVFGPVLFVLFMVQRVMQIVLFTAMLAFNADILPRDRRTEGLALLGLAGLIPLMTGGLLGDVLLAAGGFDLLLRAAAVGALVSWGIVWLLPRGLSAADARRPRRGFWAALAQRDLLPMWWIAFMFAVALESVFTFLRTFVDAREVGTVGLFFAIYGAVAIVVRLLTSPRLDVLPQRPMLILAIGGMAVGFAFLAGARQAVPFVLAATLIGFGHGLSFPIMLSLVVQRSRLAERGSAMAIFTSIFDVALLLAAPVVGGVIDWRGYTEAFGMVAVVLGAGVVVYGLWDRALERAMSAAVEGAELDPA